MLVEEALGNPRNNTNNRIKISMMSVEYRKYKYICKEKNKIQLMYKENLNDHMRIYSGSIVIIHREKHNIPPKSRTCIMS
jgi:succinylglutamate desuccinylase